MAQPKSILFIDAYDSFAENIAALLHQQLDVEVLLIKIDCDISRQYGQGHGDFFSQFDAIVLGPGPGNPGNESDVGLFNQVWEHAPLLKIPVLGICLGFQSLCAQYGLPIVRSGVPCHGHAKEVLHVDLDIFNGSGKILATNYNSLGVRAKDFKLDTNRSRRTSTGSLESFVSLQSLQSADSVFSKPSGCKPSPRPADNLDLLAWDEDDWVMAIKHKELPFYGFQFHPESCKSNLACQELIKRWWTSATAYNASNRRIHSAKAWVPDPVSSSDDDSDLSFSLETYLQNRGTGANVTGAIVCTSVPVYHGVNGIDTMCQQLSPERSVVMLESTKRGRFSIYAFPDESNFRIEYAAGECRVYEGSFTVPTHTYRIDRTEMITILESFMCSQHINDDGGPIPFRGGLVGYLSYGFGIDSLGLDVPSSESCPSVTPEMSLLWVDRSIVVDHATSRAYIQSIRGPGRNGGSVRSDVRWVEATSGRFLFPRFSSSYTPQTPAPNPRETMQLHDTMLDSTFTLPDHDRYISQIRDCQSELLAGNSYELCLTTEATVTTPKTDHNPRQDPNPRHDPNSWLLYKNVQCHNPVPFAAYIRLNKTTIMSSSPEQFLSWSRAGTIDMIPMKGTVKKTPGMTLEHATNILSSAKESAENLMIADLIRHDLYSTVGRDALVEVVKLCDVVETETVFSLVSHIRAHVPFPAGKSRESPEVSKEMTKHGIRALANTLPPGSMTGAPKKRSCEILHRLEQRDRGVYSGAVGYMDVTGNGAWSVCIRTAFSNEDEDIPATDGNCEMQKWHVGAGGAITVLSDEEQEWEEMMTKLDSVLRGFRVHGDPAAVEATIDRFNELLTEAPDFTDTARVRATIEELQEALEACHT
ncbi:hypothetical protein H2202_008806 [Exophiala xenobiotica]|nr:hypothetical protein H2202_008806 [Exophiala xenobiotica]KAK5212312.1 hypothetical protein LTR41_002554 [Exophiala xenobiotica]KAK5219605.1 hypothetical protein LTR72_007989 [Exophiala xenobiotica]KAK5231736.1 hypothetical protein LTR47_007139 [Exophiala xenobiotica]KAK5244696.1 hypothetical protein LTS06_009755 [Exophiala xenobiotica]